MQLSIVLDFLKELKEHNDKEWFQVNKTKYEKAKSTFLEIVQDSLTHILTFDESLSALKPKDCIFRANRDIRFSNDKRPYKENMGAIFAKGGRKSKFACYYLHLEPNNQSFVAGGCYMPEPDVLQNIRQEIDYNGDKLHKIMENKHFQKFYGDFEESMKLKTSPKGFDKNHVDVEWLKLKSFTVWHKFTDEEVLNYNFQMTVNQAFTLLHPFVLFLNEAVREE
jgi:uncharacterized protein (TIGR02453 family)